jgi:hypothetical protein
MYWISGAIGSPSARHSLGVRDHRRVPAPTWERQRLEYPARMSLEKRGDKEQERGKASETGDRQRPGRFPVRDRDGGTAAADLAGLAD